MRRRLVRSEKKRAPALPDSGGHHGVWHPVLADCILRRIAEKAPAAKEDIERKNPAVHAWRDFVAGQGVASATARNKLL